MEPLDVGGGAHLGPPQTHDIESKAIQEVLIGRVGGGGGSLRCTCTIVSAHEIHALLTAKSMMLAQTQRLRDLQCF